MWSQNDEIFSRARSVLGIGIEADNDAIKRAYWSVIRRYHPDLYLNDPALGKQACLINEAYEILTEKPHEPNLLKNDFLVESVTGNPVTSFDSIPSYGNWLIGRGFYDFVRPM